MPPCTRERTRFAELLRAFYLGRITNFELEERAWPLFEKEQSLFDFFHWGPWGSYSDNRESKFDTQELTPEGRKTVARWILFLKSGQTYHWPLTKRLSPWLTFSLLLSGIPVAWMTGIWEYASGGFIPLIVLGLIRDRLHQRRMHASGDVSLWPFQDQQSLEQALQFPPYLKGSPQNS